MSNRVRISRARPVTIAPLLGLALGFVPSVLGAPLLGPAGASWAPVQTIDHIQIVTDLESLPSEYWHPSLGSETNPLIQELRPLDQTTRNLLRIALDRLPAALHGSISKLSIAVYGGEGVAGDAYGNNIIFSSALLSDQAQLNNTIAHEATHCFQALMEVARHTDFGNVTQAAKDAVEKAEAPLFNSSIGRILRRLQRGAMIADNGYPDYAGPAWEARYTAAGAAVSDGFVTPYAAEEPREDLAEIVATFLEPGFASHAYCAQFEGLDGRVEPQQALAFAKLNFVRALGLIEEGQYRQCVRSADPVDAAIISMGSREYSGDLRHGTQTVSHEDLDDDWIMWRIRGVASDARLEIRVRVRRTNDAPVGTVIGFYELDAAGSHGMAADALIPIAGQNVITFQRTDTSNDTEQATYSRISGGGYVLITDFTEDLVKGYAFDVPFYSIIDIDVPPTDTLDVIWFLWER